jgi:magnesium transporter
MLMDTGGNCGSQSSTLIIRGLALGDIKFKDIFKVIFKELRVSFIVGIVLALINGLRIYVMYQHEVVPALLLAVVIGFTLVCVVMLAKLIGCVLPMLADKIGLDPALMASPLITTIVDTCSVLIFFNIAMTVLSNYIAG